ncbi:protein-L-isoaspartate(D-aspartate) O-methyltransferase [Halomicroarcula sp. GCM10025324]|uniref:protein-L-isoaspartate(D-aspartate) O-methyltransferase n=1 Tax=Haloarcula TaxID=2237 RepID=UPI0023E83E52|nr:protein-L-isoaspartate(D-aspartate) O-methyltransferase [Halomicroarcula sp. ZS-22-S1]
MPDWGRQRAALAERLGRSGQFDEAVVDALAAVPRHRFVPESRREASYKDHPLPIGEGQTISAPHMVVRMLDLLDLQHGDTVLEIGTGCGYHAAVAAELVGPEHVYSVEYRASLAERARETLSSLGYGDVSIRVGDGKRGWPEHAPYERTYLTCAAPSLPQPVVEQTQPGGLVLAPVGRDRQRLVSARRHPDGSLSTDTHGAVRFVRLQ